MTNAPKRAASFMRSLYSQVELALKWPLFSYGAFLLSFGLTFVARLVGIPGAGNISLAQNLAVSALAHISAYAAMFVLCAPVMKWLPSKTGLVLLGMAVSGAIRGATLQLLLEAVTGEDASLMLFRIVNNAFLFTLVALVSGYASHEVGRRLTLLRELRAKTKELEGALQDNQHRIEGWYQQLANNLKLRLGMQLQYHLNSADDQMAVGLKEQVAEVIRPLSHELMNEMPVWEVQPKAERESGIGLELLKGALTGHWQVYPIATTVLGAVSCFSAYLHVSGWGQFWQFALACLILFLGMVIFRKVYFRLEAGKDVWTKFGIYIGVAMALTFPSALYSVHLMGLLAGGYFWPAILVSAGLSMTTWLLAVGNAARIAMVQDQHRLEGVNDQLRWLLARTSAMMWERQRDLSKILHGPVQGALSAAAIRLDLAKNNPDDLPRIIAESRASIMEAVNAITEPAGQTLSVRASLGKIADGWDGVTQVETLLSKADESAIDADHSCSRILIDLVQEAVANAARHGEARTVDVRISRQGEKLVQVEVNDDGLGMLPDAPRGLGSRLLDECAIEWSRVNLRPEGVKLTFVIPLEAASA